ncbi:MAG: tRNA preQ1(34) S-adenosylmethionine ribosyltransferase-isomerase QueA [Acidobacteriota bacterium]
MHISDFDYQLPTELIAQHPAYQRDSSRMLIVERVQRRFSDHHFREFPQLLRAGDCLVLNDTRVFPARLLGTRAGYSAHVELFLVRNLGADRWEALVKPGRALRPGNQAVFGDGSLRAEVLESLPSGRRIIELKSIDSQSVESLIDRFGVTPLPPYIKRADAASLRLDEQSYQTVYAHTRGAVAAPTAGLHFTPQVLEAVRAGGVHTVTITHHVGYGTFQPVRVEQIEQHSIEAEQFIIDAEAAAVINSARAQGGRIIAVGTTTTRALETAANRSGEILACRRATDLFIYPGYHFKAIDALLTNFHLPKSSLIMLVAAFAGHKLVMDAYRHAVSQRYRFYSYGDCMFIY